MSTPTEIADIADSRDLEGARFDDLDAVFEVGSEPQPAELDGLYRGRVIAVAGTDALPEPFRNLLSAVYRVRLIPWVGKRFGVNPQGGRHGMNTWLTARGPDLVGFVCRSGDDELVLDYDIKANPKPLRSILGGLRRLAPALYLGRMELRVGDQSVPLLYFTLDHT